jgi:hypothetical protein
MAGRGGGRPGSTVLTSPLRYRQAPLASRLGMTVAA